MAIGFPHAFEGPIDRFGVGRSRVIWYTVLFLPPSLERKLPFQQFPRLRVEGEIADLPVEGAWMPTGDDRRYFIVAPRILKGAELGVGDIAEMRFAIADQNAVDVPPELREALAKDGAAQDAWDGLTAGKKRGLTHKVYAAKGADTRARRVSDVVTALTNGEI